MNGCQTKRPKAASYREYHWFESARRYYQESLVNQGFILYPEVGVGG